MKTYKATAISPANIAFIKYWGWSSEKNKRLLLPANDSISMNLDNCVTKTTVEFSPLFEKDSVKIKFFGKKEKEVSGNRLEKVLNQVNRIRGTSAGNCCTNYRVKVVSHNGFPADSGIASSASAFSALTLAASSALGLDWDKKRLSIETRLSGSGSACRSVCGGFSYWQKGDSSDSSYAYQLKDENWWDLVDIVAVVNAESKEKSSREGHDVARTSSYYKTRLKELPRRIENIKAAIAKKDFSMLGEMIEKEAISMHTVCMTCCPPIFYWNPATLEIIKAVRSWRDNGLLAYFTIDAGPNVHVICQKKDASEVNRRLKNLHSVLFTIINRTGQGVRLSDQHLF